MDGRQRVGQSRRVFRGGLRPGPKGPEGCPKNSGLSASLILMAFD